VSLRSRALQALFAGLGGFSLALLGGCVYREQGPPQAHFETFSAKPPQGDSVTVCHAYGCKAQTAFTFTPSDIAELFVLMSMVPRVDSPREERRAIAYAIGWNGAARCTRGRNRDGPARHGLQGFGRQEPAGLRR
jgi:hypothetical protein